MGEDERGFSALQREAIERGDERGNIMTIKLLHCETERAPFVSEWFQAHHLCHRAIALDFIVINDGDKIVQSKMPRRERRFPSGAFVAFAVREKHIYFALRLVLLERERHADAD